jgi:3-oxoacyl-[acyl-carrier protein] reductase/meso-butanediol dehydrogenase/(S,S)-butanediol dehydrogenase/diacetyl reductase
MPTVIITGGTKGIGAEISRKFLKEGWQVLIAARKKSELATESHKHLRFQSMDVRREIDHHSLVKTALDWSGSLDCYINCAGFSQWAPINNVDEELLNRMIDINLKGTFWGCKVAAEYLSSGGAIVNVSSLAGKRGSSNNSVYCASKFGVNGITQSLAKELGPRGIRVNAVCPVYVETPGLLKALENLDSPPRGQDTAQYLKDFSESNTAMGRLPRGNEIADLCFYLTSSQASAITGQCINVDCGVLPQ